MKPSRHFDDAALFRSALNGIGYRGSWWADHQEGWVRYSKEAGLLFPLSDRQLSKRIELAQFDQFIHDDDRQWLQQRRRSPLFPGVHRSIVEFRVLGRDGERWVQAHSVREVTPDGTPLRGQGVSFDITDIKALGEAVSGNPSAPMFHPLYHLVDGVALSIAAAKQIPNPSLVGRLEEIAVTVGRLLASDLLGIGRRTKH